VGSKSSLDKCSVWVISEFYIISVLAVQVDPKFIEFRPLGGTLHAATCRSSWTVNLGFEVEDFMMDPEQDLLIAVEYQ
jgi:hypothetical protein